MTNCLHNSLASNLFRFFLYSFFFISEILVVEKKNLEQRNFDTIHIDIVIVSATHPPFSMNNNWNLISHQNMRYKLSFPDSHSFTIARWIKWQLWCYQLCKYFRLNTRRRVINETMASLIEYVRKKQFNKIRRLNNQLKNWFPSKWNY